MAAEHELIGRLIGFGLHPQTISAATGIPLSEIAQVRVTAPTDDDLGSAARRLAWRAIGEAFDILDTGSPTAKASLIKSLLPALAKMVGREEASATDPSAVLEQLFAEMRGGVGVGLPTAVLAAVPLPEDH